MAAQPATKLAILFPLLLLVAEEARSASASSAHALLSTRVMDARCAGRCHLAHASTAAPPQQPNGGLVDGLNVLALLTDAASTPPAGLDALHVACAGEPRCQAQPSVLELPLSCHWAGEVCSLEDEVLITWQAPDEDVPPPSTEHAAPGAAGDSAEQQQQHDEGDDAERRDEGAGQQQGSSDCGCREEAARRLAVWRWVGRGALLLWLAVCSAAIMRAAGPR